jgi:putative tryptophan/tyrosine transport system substrate-binding protein
MAVGPDRTAQYRRAAYYVDQLLRGARPAELPVQHTPVEVTVNLATARTLGVTIPPEVLAGAEAVR